MGPRDIDAGHDRADLLVPGNRGGHDAKPHDSAVLVVTRRPFLTVVTDDPTPPYEQLRRQLHQLIESGVLAVGDRLPPLRQLASDLGLAVNTVARAYRELEAIGMVSSRRGGGTRVTHNAPRVPDAEMHRLLRQQAARFVRQARLLGVADDRIVHAVAEVLDG
jgi:GntR family transcriptional regulator